MISSLSSRLTVTPLQGLATGEDQFLVPLHAAQGVLGIGSKLNLARMKPRLAAAALARTAAMRMGNANRQRALEDGRTRPDGDRSQVPDE